MCGLVNVAQQSARFVFSTEVLQIIVRSNGRHERASVCFFQGLLALVDVGALEQVCSLAPSKRTNENGRKFEVFISGKCKTCGWRDCCFTTLERKRLRVVAARCSFYSVVQKLQFGIEAIKSGTSVETLCGRHQVQK